MENSVDNLRTALATCGWQEVEMTGAEHKAGLNGVFSSEYAIIGVILAKGVSEVSSSWALSQLALADRRKGTPSDRLKDAYLLFLLDRIDAEDAAVLESILSNTQECRKVCVSLESRTLEEALKDLPFVCRKLHIEEAEPPSDTAAEIRDAGLSARLLNDLATRAASTILDNLMAGQYQPQHPKKGRHAAQKTDP